jgi:hypothetical protein
MEFSNAGHSRAVLKDLHPSRVAATLSLMSSPSRV